MQSNQTQRDKHLSPKEQFLADLGYKELQSKGANPLEVIAETLENVLVSKDTLVKLLKVRSYLMQQQSYMQLGLHANEIYRDVATHASLWGQLTLIDTLIESVKLAEES